MDVIFITDPQYVPSSRINGTANGEGIQTIKFAAKSYRNNAEYD